MAKEQRRPAGDRTARDPANDRADNIHNSPDLQPNGRPILKLLDTAHNIVIRHDLAEYVVTIDPPSDIQGLGGSFLSKREAYGHASGRRMLHRWPIVDMTGRA